jgi:hypothetical protein
MKRLKGAGICLGLAFAFSALVPVAAQASSPEYGQCVAAKKAVYTESKCETVAEKKGKPDHKGHFEWEAGPLPTCVAVKKGFYSSSECATRDEKKGKPAGKFEKVCAESCADFTTTSGPVTFYNFTPENGSEPEKLPQGKTLTGVGGAISCAHSTSVGEILGPSENAETVTYTGCESGGESCTTPGEASGTIVAPDIFGDLVTLPAGKGVGLLTRLGGNEIAFDCGPEVEDSIEFGHALGTVTGNISTPSTTSTQTFAVTNPSEGVQAQRYYLNEENVLVGGPALHLETHLTGYAHSGKFGQFIATGVNSTETVTNEAAEEIRP